MLALAQSPVFSMSQEERRFRIILLRLLVIFLVVGGLLPWLPLPSIPPPPTPPRMVSMKLLPPPPVPQKKKIKPPVKQALAPQPKKEVKPVRKVEKKKAPVARQPTAAELRAQARRNAAKKGLMALSGELDQLAKTTDLAALDSASLKRQPQDWKGKETRISSQVLKQGSGGVAEVNLAEGLSETRLSEHRFSEVNYQSAAQMSEEANHDGQRRRGREELALVLERGKGPLNILYTRALRRQAGLRGRVLFELTILPSGRVDRCRILESELARTRLEQRMCLRLARLDFGNKDVDTTIISYPVVFEPPA